MTKAEARKEFLVKRQALSDAERDELNRQILKIFYTSGETIHVFLSMERTHEPNTWKIIDQILPHKKIVIPKINASGTLDHFYYEGPDQLQQNNLGILEPVKGIPANVKKIDFVLVPLAAYDVNGNRVGYGKGFYDRFLKECRPDCIKAGLSFFGPTEKISDIEPHDVPLDICFTPNKLYTFGSS